MSLIRGRSGPSSRVQRGHLRSKTNVPDIDPSVESFIREVSRLWLADARESPCLGWMHAEGYSVVALFRPLTRGPLRVGFSGAWRRANVHV